MIADALFKYIRDDPRARSVAMQIKDRTNHLLTSKSLRNRHRHLDAEKDLFLRKYIRETRDSVDDESIEWEINSRLRGFRNTVIPWLSETIDLSKSRILEVGCGSGASTVALAEQGGNVVGIDIDPLCIDIGRERLRSYDLNADLRLVDGSALPQEQFDLIIFFASLEHMTQDERLYNLTSAWDLLKSGGRLCVIETPNRLWNYDDHTSALPFFDWLPDTLAVRYARHSPKLKSVFAEGIIDDYSILTLARHGRGLSFHEFKVAGIPCEEVEACMVEYLRRNPIYAAKYFLGSDRNFSKIIRKLEPSVARAFFYHRLDLLIRKT